MTKDDVIRIVRPRYAAIVSPCLPKDQRSPEFDEIWLDLQRLAWSVAEKHSDPTCVELHTEEIYGELLRKFAVLIDKERFDRMNRRDYFRYVKTAFTNTSRGLVHRHKHTQKRSSGALMPLGETAPASEVSLDDEEAHVHLGTAPCQYDEIRMKELKDQVRARLLPAERLVFDALTEHPPEAGVIMELEGAIGRPPRETRRYNIDAVLAQSVGLPRPIWDALQKEVRRKTSLVLDTMDNENLPTDEQTEKTYEQSVLELQATFGVHIPSSLERKVASRLFTIAARHQFKKVVDDDNVKANLLRVNAILPETLGMTFSCFGVMHNSTRAECRNCSLAGQCETKAKEHGFDEDIIDFSHFPIKVDMGSGKFIDTQTRTAVLGATPRRVATIDEIADSSVAVPLQDASNEDVVRDQEIRGYLNENFKCSKSKVKGELFYRDGKNVIFVLRTKGHRTQIRLCAPSAELQRKLEKEDRSWSLPTTITAKQAVKLLDTHATQKSQQ